MKIRVLNSQTLISSMALREFDQWSWSLLLLCVFGIAPFANLLPLVSTIGLNTLSSGDVVAAVMGCGVQSWNCASKEVSDGLLLVLLLDVQLTSLSAWTKSGWLVLPNCLSPCRSSLRKSFRRKLQSFSVNGGRICWCWLFGCAFCSYSGAINLAKSLLLFQQVMPRSSQGLPCMRSFSRSLLDEDETEQELPPPLPSSLPFRLLSFCGSSG